MNAARARAFSLSLSFCLSVYLVVPTSEYSLRIRAPKNIRSRSRMINSRRAILCETLALGPSTAPQDVGVSPSRNALLGPLFSGVSQRKARRNLATKRFGSMCEANKTSGSEIHHLARASSTSGKSSGQIESIRCREPRVAFVVHVGIQSSSSSPLFLSPSQKFIGRNHTGVIFAPRVSRIGDGTERYNHEHVSHHGNVGRRGCRDVFTCEFLTVRAQFARASPRARRN